jgi:hypothetical protein
MTIANRQLLFAHRYVPSHSPQKGLCLCQILVKKRIYRAPQSGRSSMQHIYQVQPWRKVAANNEDEAAFKATGERLSKMGPRDKIRVRVIKHAAYGPPATVYYAN